MNQKIKISQLPAKGSNLAAADLLEIAEFTGTGYISKSITGQEIIDAIPLPPSGITIGTTAITSGTVGRVLFEGTGNVVQESANLFWDETNGRLGIGTSTPAFALDVVAPQYGGVRFTASDATFLRLDTTTTNFQISQSNTQTSLTTSNYGPLYFINNGGASTRLSLFANGNFAIGSTTDAGFRLDVNGTARVQDDITVSRNKNQTTGVFISNTTNSASSAVAINLTSSSGEAVFAKKPALGSVYKTISGNDTYIYNGTAGDISILNDFATGRIKFAAGGASTAQMTLFSTGNLGINTTTDAGFRLDVNGTARATQFFSGASNYADSIGVGISVDGANFSNSVNASSANMLLLKGSSRFAYTTAVGAVYYFCGRYSGGASTWIPTDFMKLQLSGSEMWGIASGTATTNAININLNLNFTGGTSTVRGIYYNPTLTSMVGTTHYAFHSTSGRIRFEGLPTSSAGLSAGDIWNDAGTLKIV